MLFLARPNRGQSCKKQDLTPSVCGVLEILRLLRPRDQKESAGPQHTEGMDATSRVEIRRATRGDMPAVGLLGAHLVRVHHEYDPDRFMAPGGDVGAGYAAFLGAQLDHPDAVVFVAEHHGRIEGYLYAAVEPRNWKELRERAGFVHDIFVDEQCRGGGIANALLNAAFEWMRERGVPRAMLWTASANEHARGLFERRGFRSTMLEMTKELGA